MAGTIDHLTSRLWITFFGNILKDNHYDFNYQQSRYLSQDISILPGDSLITECTYSTQQRDKPTLGGYSTKEEMCLAFVLHYPRTKLAGCYSIPPVRYFFEGLGIQKFYGKNISHIEQVLLEGQVEETDMLETTTSNPFETKPGEEMSYEANHRAILALQRAREYTVEGESGDNDILNKLVVEEPAQFRNRTFMEILHNLPYNETVFTSKVEEYFYKGLHLTFCRKRDASIVIKETIERLPTFQQYEVIPNFQCSHKSKNLSPLIDLSNTNNSASRITAFQLIPIMNIFIFFMLTL